MVKMQKAYRFRAYPSHEQKSLLDRQMYLSKRLYNLLLEKSQSHYKDYGKTFTKYDMNKWMTSLKKKNPEFRELYSQASQQVRANSMLLILLVFGISFSFIFGTPVTLYV